MLSPGCIRKSRRQGQGGADQDRQGDAVRGAGGDGADGHGGFSHCSSGRPHHGVGGEEGADGALMPARAAAVGAACLMAAWWR
jgi:hypothetical protein